MVTDHVTSSVLVVVVVVTGVVVVGGAQSLDCTDLQTSPSIDLTDDQDTPRYQLQPPYQPGWLSFPPSDCYCFIVR